MRLDPRPAAAGLLIAAGPIALAGAVPVSSQVDRFSTCEESFAADPQDWKGCGCYYQVAIEAGLQEEAIRRVERHRELDPLNPCLAFTLGRLHLLARRGETAVSLFAAAAQGYLTRGLAGGEVYARINLATALATLGATGEEIGAELERARLAAETSGDRILRAEVALKEAQLLLRRGGDLGWIEDSLRWIRREALADAHASLRRDTLLLLGEVLYGRGRFAEAEQVFAEATAVTTEAKDRFGEAAARLNRAAAAGARLRYPGQREEVETLLREAVIAAEAANNPFAEIEARKRLGKLLGGAPGREQLLLAVKQAEALGSRAPEVLAGALAASAVDLVAEDPPEARRRVDEASALLLSATDPWSQVYGWGDRLRVLWATAPRDEALAAATSVLEIVERLEAIQSTEVARAEVSSVWTEIYQWLAGQLAADAQRGGEEGTLSTAFAIAERMRARLLLESLAAGGAGPATATDEESEGAWLEVEGQIVGIHRRLLDPRVGSDRRVELLHELEALEAREEHLAARQRQLRSGSVSQARDFVGLEALQSTLAPDEAVLTFQVGRWEALDGSFAGGSWLLAVTATDTQLHRLPDLSELEPAVEIFLHLFERRDGSETVPAAALYQRLLSETLAELPPGVKRLVVVPAGPLYRLPFAALRETPAGPPLARRYEIFVVPSATVWLRLRRRPSVGAATLALADPAAPGPETPLFGKLSSRDRSWTGGLTLPSLPYARREGRSALRRLGPPGRLLLGAEASESALKAGAKGGLRVLHLGTHAVLDEAHPQRSAVILAGTADEDGLLRPREAAGLDLDGAVVVLAACQSAQGTVLQGEGALSLARAFLEGGARAVVGSLWPVVDAESAEVFDRFYRYLAQGMTVAGALTRTQRESLDAGAPAAAWAGLIALGDGSAVVASAASPSRPGDFRLSAWLGWGLVVAALLVFIAVGLRRRGTKPSRMGG